MVSICPLTRSGFKMDILNDYPLILAAVIFVARIIDVSLGTLRTILVFRSYRILAALIGFFEVLIWLIAAGKVIQNLDTWYLAVAYAGGFASGNIAGIWLESKLAMGSELVRVVSENRDIELANRLREDGYPVIELTGRGRKAVPVEVLLVVEKRRKLGRLLRQINQIDPDAVYTISDVKRHSRRTDAAPGKKQPTSPWLSHVKKK